MLVLVPKLRIPYPILLVLGGLALGFMPGLPEIDLPPDLVLVGVLPPLLYGAAFFTSLRDLRANFRPVGLLAVGLVLLTIVVVAVVAHEIVPGLPWAAAFVLGAVVSPTDPIAATAIMHRLGVPRRIVSFVLPLGYSFNLDGTTLYLSLASVFVAQLAGVSMTFGQQLVMMLTLMLTSKGVAGVPRAALVVLTATLTQFGLPLEGAAILLGIDQIMDMGRTAVNVMGNCIATAVVARWEGVFDDAQMRAFAVDSTYRAA